jgi:hypothetical protein
MQALQFKGLYRVSQLLGDKKKFESGEPGDGKSDPTRSNGKEVFVCTLSYRLCGLSVKESPKPQSR